MLSTGDYLAVLELENDAAARIQVLAAPFRAIVMHADHAAALTLEHILQGGLEGPPRISPIAAKLGKGRLATHMVAGNGASPGRVPRGVLVKKLGERLHVARVESRVAASYDFSVLSFYAHEVVLLGPVQ